MVKDGVKKKVKNKTAVENKTAAENLFLDSVTSFLSSSNTLFGVSFSSLGLVALQYYLTFEIKTQVNTAISSMQEQLDRKLTANLLAAQAATADAARAAIASISSAQQSTADAAQTAQQVTAAAAQAAQQAAVAAQQATAASAQSAQAAIIFAATVTGITAMLMLMTIAFAAFNKNKE